MDSKLSFEHQTRRVAGTCFGVLKVLRKTLDLLPIAARKILVHSLVTSRLDYGNILYLGATAKCMLRLQGVQNAAARLILKQPRRATNKGESPV